MATGARLGSPPPPHPYSHKLSRYCGCGSARQGRSYVQLAHRILVAIDQEYGADPGPLGGEQHVPADLPARPEKDDRRRNSFLDDPAPSAAIGPPSRDRNITSG